MQKLKKKKKYIITNPEFFIKKNNLKEKKLKLNTILFKNNILLKNKNINVIEFNNKNMFINNNNNLNLIYTIKRKYENQLLLNFNLDRNIILYFNKLIFKNIIKKYNIIKGRVINISKKYKYFYIYIFGYIFSIKPKDLYSKKKWNFNLRKNNKKKIIKKKIIKKINKSYRLRYINFFINIKYNFNYKKINISRTIYLKKLDSQKKNLSRKLHV